MTDRRRHPPIVLPLLFLALVIYALLREPEVKAFDGPHYVIQNQCPEYAANIPADTGIEEFCLRTRGY